jgi:hypothetical protein
LASSYHAMIKRIKTALKIPSRLAVYYRASNRINDIPKPKY